jgi:hypothetical protein
MFGVDTLFMIIIVIELDHIASLNPIR